MKIGILGSSGFIGGALVDQCLQQGISIVEFQRGSHRRVNDRELSSNVVCLPDLTRSSASDLSRLFKGLDVLVNCAWDRGVLSRFAGEFPKLFDSNEHLVRVTGEAAVLAEVPKYIFLSSVKVFGEGNLPVGSFEKEGMRDATIYDQDSIASPLTPYARQKLLCERVLKKLCQGAKTQLFIIRPPLVYGGRPRGNVKWISRAIKLGIPLPIPTEPSKRSIIEVSNLARFCLKIVSRDNLRTNTFVVSDISPVSTQEIIRNVAFSNGLIEKTFPVSNSFIRCVARLPGLKNFFRSYFGSLQVDPSFAFDQAKCVLESNYFEICD